MQTRQSNKVNRKQEKKVVTQRKKFDFELTNQLSKKLIKCHHKNLFTQKFWFLSDGIYQEKNWQNIIPFMSSNNCRSIDLQRNEYSQILLQVCHPLYTHLRCINFQRNLIANIEALAYANMENLQELNLNHNFIVTTKTLNKTRWPLFSKLSIEANPVKKLDFYRMKIGIVECQFNFEELNDDCLDEDWTTFSAKIESSPKKGSSIKINSKNRIIQPSTHRSISKKLSKIEVKVYEWQ